MKSLALIFFVVTALFGCAGPAEVSDRKLIAAPRHPAATWPWKGASEAEIYPGVSQWNTTSADGTVCELYRFNFRANPRLRLELYDQDQDDGVPFDNRASYQDRGIGAVLQDLPGKVILAWNGPFFAYSDDRSEATHIAPVVLNGVARYNVGQHRWTFGVKQTENAPSFKLLHMPSIKDIEAEQFSYGASGVQCLILDGKPLRLEPFPEQEFRQSPVPSTSDEAGHIPLVDHMRTSRTSLAWDREMANLYVLIVEEADHELESKLALKRGEEQKSGWTLADIQSFWLDVGVFGAINSDGGAVTQRAVLKGPDYELMPSRMSSTPKRRVMLSSAEQGLDGGTLMSFYITER